MIDTAAIWAQLKAGDEHLNKTRAFLDVSRAFMELIDEKVGLTPDIELRHPELTGFLMVHSRIVHASAEDSNIEPYLVDMLESYDDLVKRLSE